MIEKTGVPTARLDRTPENLAGSGKPFHLGGTGDAAAFNKSFPG
jgi:hypothetical protein